MPKWTWGSIIQTVFQRKGGFMEESNTQKPTAYLCSMWHWLHWSKVCWLLHLFTRRYLKDLRTSPSLLTSAARILEVIISYSSALTNFWTRRPFLNPFQTLIWLCVNCETWPMNTNFMIKPKTGGLTKLIRKTGPGIWNSIPSDQGLLRTPIWSSHEKNDQYINPNPLLLFTSKNNDCSNHFIS